MSIDPIHNLLKSLPKVDECILLLQDKLSSSVPEALLKKIVRAGIDAERKAILAGTVFAEKNLEEWISLFSQSIHAFLQPCQKRVVNATGVVLHTNLGRSLLGEDVCQHLLLCASSYTNLEMDLQDGKRGSRYDLVEEIICDITGAESALVVNNNAAAVMLVLDALASGKEIIVSRGELVEIGGSFRIPDVVSRSGAIMVGVGTTNRTHLYDYKNAITDMTALLLKVHTSNFKVVGFTASVSCKDLVALAAEHQLYCVEDLGSGCLVDLSPYGFPREMTVQEVIASGTDVVTFSGDKLLGGPQAGIIAGKKEVVDKLKTNPLTRVLRIDKLTLAALESTLRNYYDLEAALLRVPTLALLVRTQQAIRQQVDAFISSFEKLSGVSGAFDSVALFSQTGGGSIPDHAIPSWGIRVDPCATANPSHLIRSLRSNCVPIIARIENDAVLLDFRTILKKDENILYSFFIDYFS